MFLSVMWSLVRLGSLARGTVTKTVQQNYLGVMRVKGLSGFKE